MGSTFDERIAFLEGRVVEHSQMMDGVRQAIGSLEARMDRRFEAIDRRFEAIDRCFEAVEQRFGIVEMRLTALDQKVDRGFAALDQKIDQRFAWLVGIQVTTLVAVVAAVLVR